MAMQGIYTPRVPGHTPGTHQGTALGQETDRKGGVERVTLVTANYSEIAVRDNGPLGQGWRVESSLGA